ncbi:MAG: phosphoglycerate kinase [Pseudomonadota bacterium]
MSPPHTSIRTLDQADVTGKRVLVRVDLNVPMDADGTVTDDTRIRAIVPTVAEIAEHGGTPVLLAHFGRPKGQTVPDLSLQRVVPKLEAALGRKVTFAADCVGDTAETTLTAVAAGTVVLLENTRFHAGEEANDPALARDMAQLGDLFINDAFATAHRAHASTAGLADHIPAYAGRCMEAELNALDAALTTPDRPLAAIVGGAKISTKIDVLGNLAEKVDHLVVGGAMANTFLAARGYAVGASLVEDSMLDTALEIDAFASRNGCHLVLPADVVVATEFRAGASNRVSNLNSIAPDEMILDAGPATITAISALIDNCKTLVWNGPFGAFEIAPFDRATTEIARHAAERTRAGRLVTVAGGGDTVAALNQAGVGDGFSYVSTAGGAFLEWLEGKTLPGVEVLRGTALADAGS